MKKWFVLLMVLVLAVGFNIGCLSDTEEHQKEVSFVNIPIAVSVFQPEYTFVAAKDSEGVPGISMDRVLVEVLGESGEPLAVLSVFIVPPRKVSMGTHLMVKQVNYRESSTGVQASFFFVE